MKMVETMEYQHLSKRKRCLRIGFEYPNYYFLLIITNLHTRNHSHFWGIELVKKNPI